MDATVRILIAEDDTMSMQIMKNILLKNGYPFVEAVDGEMAWERLQDDPTLRLAIIDWMMPVTDGIELCRRMKSTENNPYRYVIMLTSKNSRDEVVQAFDAGADDYVSKPAEPSILRARIDAGLRIIAMHDQLNSYATSMEKLARERAEQLTHADRLTTVGLLGAGVAHEINNAATFISINLQMMIRYWGEIADCCAQNFDSAQRGVQGGIVNEIPEMLQEMQSGIVRITHIVEGLKTYARFEPGRKGLTDLRQCIETSLKMCSSRLKKNVDVARSYDDGSYHVMADERRLEQVFVNLILNAADALENRKNAGIRIRTSRHGNDVVITMSDNGPGIRPDALEKLFHPFFTTKENGKGTGLGLYICKTIVEEYGGTIHAANGADGGAEFTLQLPVSEKESGAT